MRKEPRVPTPESSAATTDERIVLTPEERARFVAYLQQSAQVDANLVEFLDDVPPGTNGAHIRTDCKIRRDVKRAVAEELERGM